MYIPICLYFYDTSVKSRLEEGEVFQLIYVVLI